MSKTRLRRPPGWRSKPQTPEAIEGFKSKPSRQSNRADVRAAAWKKWRCQTDRAGRIETAPRDDHGVMSRRTRRSIARSIAKKAFAIMNRTDKKK